jgi:TRAP-type uncharacterized transport system fused permease subunit
LRIPDQALSFSLHAAKLASQHGFKAGAAKAAASMNPVLLVPVLGAAESLLDAANSFHPKVSINQT